MWNYTIAENPTNCAPDRKNHVSLKTCGGTEGPHGSPSAPLDGIRRRKAISVGGRSILRKPFARLGASLRSGLRWEQNGAKIRSPVFSHHQEIGICDDAVQCLTAFNDVGRTQRKTHKGL